MTRLNDAEAAPAGVPERRRAAEHPRSRGVHRLVVVSHVKHYRHEGRLHGFGPLARELDVWADLFPEVVIACPYAEGTPPGDYVAYTRTNISVEPQWETGGATFRAKVAQALAVPAHVWRLGRALRRADAIHVRCPGNLGLLGAVLAPLFSRNLVAKYAGQWNGYPGEARTVRLQRAILGSRWWRGPVTVYGRWPNQPPHVVPFFTSLLTEEHLRRAQAAAQHKALGSPLRVLFVGRLSEAKNVDVLIAAIGRLRDEAIPVRCTIVGDGPRRPSLERQAAELGLGDQVAFTGGLPLEGVFDHYERNDVLVLASQTEGWPKAIAEAMAFGLVCVGTDRGLVPQMLGEGRGLVVAPRDLEALASALRQIAHEPHAFSSRSRRAAEWSRRYSLENLGAALRDLLSDRWDVELMGTA